MWLFVKFNLINTLHSSAGGVAYVITGSITEDFLSDQSVGCGPDVQSMEYTLNEFLLCSFFWEGMACLHIVGEAGIK